ncbi:uncharacterized protein BO80DRAFT_428930 [Aspergillus ibericus CBS 121593]|uniref:Uncharacterized protein n=1 Tax=Aspergillus ibericus CBS 121593 TaxID=1448316 RepID=A0A395GMN1_9EURO|nr:hypothetical protein BO80DRAFT_428930 [Aspergillus ibericus CBS 121593]RAK96644.1 hypothetical protein BO80DRAFT_428930 [Aspergillus ibericus CBS 121593]
MDSAERLAAGGRRRRRPRGTWELKLVTMLASALLGTSRDRRQNRPGKAKPDTFARVHLNLNLFPSFPSFFPLPILSSF